MIRVGITGGIGSGKSTVAQVFQTLGIPVFDADATAKRIMNEDANLKEQILQHFGPSVYNADGFLHRAALAAIVFGDKEKLALLNSLVHPASIRAAEVWMQQQTTPYALKEAALIFESGSQEYLDMVIGVYAPKHVRIQRVMKRDKVTREEVIKRMNNQLDEDIKMKLCDVVIYNDEQNSVIEQVLRVHENLVSSIKK